MKLKLQRAKSQGGATLGNLFIDGEHVCYTLEDEIREIEGVPVSEWKVYGNTAIPAGDYKITLENSGRFGPDTMTINDVPGFKYIRIHAGNTAKDTEGCVLLGDRLGANSIIGGTSRPALRRVRAAVRGAIYNGEPVTISINNPTAFA